LNERLFSKIVEPLLFFTNLYSEKNYVANRKAAKSALEHRATIAAHFANAESPNRFV